MRPLAEIEARLDALADAAAGPDARSELLVLAEETLEHWVRARGDTPTDERREGFRLLALHRQGSRGVPSFNACRETCRELVYHHNLLDRPADDASGRHAGMMVLLARHLLLFVTGKMQVEELGEFCCSSRPLRQEAG